MGRTEGAMDIARAARKQFPILGSRGQATVDWQLVADHGKQAYENHRQTVARLAERGGLSWCELHAVLHDRAWQKMEPAEAMLGCREAEAKYLAAVTTASAITALEAELAAMKARGDRLAEALSKGGFMMTESHRLEGYPGARKLIIGFENGDHADDAMIAICQALTEWRDQ